MKIGLIADIHGNCFALKACLEELHRLQVEKIIFLGDLCGYYPFVSECLSLWDHKKTISIRGNHDQVLINSLDEGETPLHYSLKYGNAIDRTLKTLSKQDFEVISSWPESFVLEVDGLKIFLCHGSPWDLMEGRVYPDFDEWFRFQDLEADVVLMGQTHYRMCKQVDNKLIINPGSVGQPRDKTPGASFAVFDSRTKLVDFKNIIYDLEPLIEDSLKYQPEMKYLTEVFKK